MEDWAGVAEAYEKHAEDLIRFSTGLVGPTDAADVVSAALLRSFGSQVWPTVRDHRAYLFKAVLNQARMTHRGAMRRRAREAGVAPPETTVAPEPRPEVLSAVARLSLRQRAVIVLTYWADLEPAAVAELLGIGEGSVRRHLARARARLRELLHE